MFYSENREVLVRRLTIVFEYSTNLDKEDGLLVKAIKSYTRNRAMNIVLVG